MSEIIERAAKAAYDALFIGEWPDVGTSIDADGFRTAARAAIEAVREHLIEAANSCQFHEDRHALLAAAEELDDALAAQKAPA